MINSDDSNHHNSVKFTFRCPPCLVIAMTGAASKDFSTVSQVARGIIADAMRQRGFLTEKDKR